MNAIEARCALFSTGEDKKVSNDDEGGRESSNDEIDCNSWKSRLDGPHTSLRVTAVGPEIAGGKSELNLCQIRACAQNVCQSFVG